MGTIPAEHFSEDGVFAVLNEKVVIGCQFGPDVAATIGDIGEGCEAVALRDCVRQFLKAGDILGRLNSNLFEKLLLDSEGFFFCAEGPGLIFFQFIGDISFGVGNCLLADVIGGDFVGVLL